MSLETFGLVNGWLPCRITCRVWRWLSVTWPPLYLLSIVVPMLPTRSPHTLISTAVSALSVVFSFQRWTWFITRNPRLLLEPRKTTTAAAAVDLIKWQLVADPSFFLLLSFCTMSVHNVNVYGSPQPSVCSQKYLLFYDFHLHKHVRLYKTHILTQNLMSKCLCPIHRRYEKYIYKYIYYIRNPYVNRFK